MTRKPALPVAKAAGLVFAALILGSTAASAQVLGPRPPQVEAAPAADWRSALSVLKLKPTGELERRRRYSEVEATTEDGRKVSVTFDRQGRIAEIEDESHDHDHRSGAPNAQTAIDAARRAGFQNPTLVETRKRHVVVRANNNAAETVDLHIDGAGWIYRQVWVRQ